jgi:DNA replication protein DnaC
MSYEEKEITLPALERKEFEYNCEKHGLQKITLTRMFADFGKPYCPICEKEAQAAKEAEEKRIKEQREQMAKRATIERLFSNSAIPLRFKEKRFDNFTAHCERSEKVFAQVVKYTAEFEQNSKQGKSIIMLGNTGTGKTHLATATCNHIIEKYQKTAVFTSVMQAIRRVKDTYNKGGKETEQEAINAFITPDLLVLDEVGVQFGSDAEKLILFEILNGRYENIKPTILLSNLDADKIRGALGDRIIDRMRENGGLMLVFDWKSERGK